MRTLYILLRTNFKSLVGSFRKKSTTSIVLTSILVVFLGLFLIGTFAAIAGSTAYLLVKKGLGEYAIFLSILLGFIVSLMFGVVNSTRDARGNDTDMLLSMPIPKSSIVLSKLLGQYLLDVLCSLVMLVPTYLILCIKQNESGGLFGRGILFALLIPALPLFISLLVGSFVQYLKRTTKFGQVVSTIVFVLVWLVYMLIVPRMSSMAEEIDITPAESIVKMKKLLPVYWLTEAIYSGDLKCVILSLLITLIPLALAVWIHSRGLTGTDFKVDHSKKTRKYEAGSVRKATLLMEFRRYLSSSNYVMNTLTGTMILVVTTVVIVIKGPSALASLGSIEINGETIQLSDYLVGPIAATLVAAMVNFFGSITLTTPPSVSIEGKRIWISKTLPISTKYLLDAKIIVSVLIFQPISILCCIVMAIVLKTGFVSCLLMILLTCVFQLLCSLTGLLFGLIYVRLDWTNEAQVVKSGMAMFLTLVVNFVLTIPSIVMVVLAIISGSSTFICLLIAGLTAIYAGLGVGAYAIITHYGVRKFESLNG